MRSAAPNTNHPFRTRPKHVKLSPCPIGISPQHSTNSLDANVARRGVLQHALPIQELNCIPLAVHPGIHNTVDLLFACIWWLYLRDSVAKFKCRCHVYLYSKDLT